MKLKENFKRFWTLSKNRKGFTLVELIVVIAILAILAGVAIPVYNGYIKKAETAGDQQLADAINTAFAAACISNGGIQEVPATITIDAEGRFYTTDANGNIEKYNISVNSENKDAILEDFAMFFQGNTGVFKSDAFVKHVFALPIEDGAGEEGGTEKEVVINGNKYYVSQSAIDAFKNATAFSDNVTELQGRVDTLSGAFGDLVSGRTDELVGFFGDEYAEYIANIGAQTGTEMGNATVLYIAGQTSGMTAQNAYDTLYTAQQAMYAAKQNGSNDVDSMLAGAAAGGDTLTTAALMYGAITAYTSQEGYTGNLDVTNVKNAGDLAGLFFEATGDDGFLAYANSDAFTTDMNGYIAALDTIDQVSGELNNKDSLGNSSIWTESDAVSALLGALQGK